MNAPAIVKDDLGRECNQPVPADLGATHLPVGSAQGIGTLYYIWLRYDRREALIMVSTGPVEYICWTYEAGPDPQAADPYLAAMLWALNETAEEVHAEDRLGAGDPFIRYRLQR